MQPEAPDSVTVRRTLLADSTTSSGSSGTFRAVLAGCHVGAFPGAGGPGAVVVLIFMVLVAVLLLLVLGPMLMVLFLVLLLPPAAACCGCHCRRRCCSWWSWVRQRQCRWRFNGYFNVPE